MNQGLKAAQLKRRELKQAGIKTVVLDPLEKARRNPTSLRHAITGKCWDCVGRGHDPHPRQAIRDCQIRDCTLWPVRPFQQKEPSS